MSVQRRLARFNRTFANRLIGPSLARLPGFGAVCHRGRRSGRLYRTPVRVLRSGDRYVMSLPHGPDSDWVRNVLAAGGCELRTGRRCIRLAYPRVFTDEALASIPAPLRPLFRRLNAVNFIELRPAQVRVPQA
jgi:deazaflavin-dependent oxidoreductase (nitroreductase family)